MRVKIKGEITPERLADAFAQALDKLNLASPGAKVYGANLYLTPFDADGLQFELGDEDGNEIVISIAAPPGTMVKPALSAEAQARIDAQRENAREEKKADAARRKIFEDEQDRLHRNREERYRKAELAFIALNKLTEDLLSSKPDHLIEALNAKIEDVWARLKPTEINGAKKGMLKPMPQFSMREGKLLMSSPNWKTPKIVLNPIGSLQRDRISPVWTFPDWTVATEGFMSVMADVNGDMPPTIAGSHLPWSTGDH